MRARATRLAVHVSVLVVVILALVAVPVAARPYGAEGRAGEVRYDVTPAKPRCVTVYDSVGAPMSMCFHRTATGAHSSTTTWMDQTVAAFKASWNKQVKTMGYRRPLADGGAPKNQGPNSGIDIYLADIGDDGTFGYCTNDRNPDPDGDQRIPAYCVVDNDFAEFGGTFTQRLRELRGTAAHEFFHAVHYAYDHTVPPWFSEGSAVWMEDQVFDRADTNRRYLDITALRQPEDPFDRSGAGYGAWLFWQFLAEEYGPATVRSTWYRVGQTTGTTTSEHVFKAVDAATPGSLGAVLARFGAENYAVGAWWSYAEGDGYLAALGNTRPPLAGSHELTATRTSTDVTGAPNARREIAAGARTIHYVRVEAAEAMRVSIEVTSPGSALRMRHRADGVFLKPKAFPVGGSATMDLAASDAVVLALTNPGTAATTLEYRVAKVVAP